VDSVEPVVCRVNTLGSWLTDRANRGGSGLDVLETEPGLSSGNNVADDAEVRVGVEGSAVPLECLGRNPSVTMPAKAKSCSSSRLSSDSNPAEVLVETLRSRSPALPFGSIIMGVGSRLLLNGGRRRPAQSSTASIFSSQGSMGS
jgi:hypothetical protein